MLKKNEDQTKQTDNYMGKQVIDEALQLSIDLEEKELSGSKGHEDLEFLETHKPKKRTYNKRKYDSSLVQCSIRLKFKSK